jgi:FkbM family methyltransferase
MLPSSSFEIKTVLGDTVVWPLEALPANVAKDTDQLRRCRKHKQFEAAHLLSLPPGASFLDVGAHFGDTTVTMALHARNHGRSDIRFLAVEPSRAKVAFINTVLRANGLLDSCIVVRAAVGEDEGLCRTVPNIRAKKNTKYEGSQQYERVIGTPLATPPSDSDDDSDSDSETDVFPVTTLDSLVSSYNFTPGLIHLDVEGWESRALQGARNSLMQAKHCTIIAEVWSEKEARRRGASQTAEEDIVFVMRQFPHFERNPDLLDQERNLVFKCRGSSDV